MTKHDLIQIKYHQNYILEQAKAVIKAAEKEYVKEHAPYPIGSEPRIDHIGKERKVRIQSYNVDDNGGLTPVFETLEGKALFIEKSTIIDFLNQTK